MDASGATHSIKSVANEVNMKRKFLTDLGITDTEVIKSIIDLHQSIVQDVKEDLKVAQTTITELQKNKPEPTDGTDWKQKYEDEKTAHKLTKDGYEAKQTESTKTAAIMKHLQADGANPKLTGLLLKEFDLSTIEMDGDNVKGWADIAKSVKETYAEAFGTVQTQGAPVATPQNNNLKPSKPQSPSEYIMSLNAHRITK